MSLSNPNLSQARLTGLYRFTIFSLTAPSLNVEGPVPVLLLGMSSAEEFLLLVYLSLRNDPYDLSWA